MTQRAWRPQMTASERKRGWVFFALYLLVFPYLNAWAQRALLGDAEVPAAEANVVYYALLFVIILTKGGAQTDHPPLSAGVLR